MRRWRVDRWPLIAACAAALAGCGLFVPQSLGFSAAELQARLAQRMPYKKAVLGILELELTRPRVALDPAGNRLSTLFDATVRSPLASRPYSGALQLSGVPRYESASRSIMLGAARLDVLELDGLAPGLNKQVRDLANALVPEVFERTPLHTFRPEDLRAGGVALNPGAIRMTADRLIVELVRR